MRHLKAISLGGAIAAVVLAMTPAAAIAESGNQSPVKEPVEEPITPTFSEISFAHPVSLESATTVARAAGLPVEGYRCTTPQTLLFRRIAGPRREVPQRSSPLLWRPRLPRSRPRSLRCRRTRRCAPSPSPRGWASLAPTPARPPPQSTGSSSTASGRMRAARCRRGVEPPEGVYG